ncbi:hypothetical protein EWI61_03090 [Methylolobus aquaticus]|nr:hypothetical protein EWI61_03090 [Methylolobus aquaticus]
MRTKPPVNVVPVIVLALLSCGADAAPSLCSVSEQVVFSCPLARKLVSLCASRGPAQALMSLTYRIGRAGRPPELVYPERPAAPAAYFQGGSLMYSGGGGAFIRFERGGYTYTIFTAIGRGWGQKEGVVVDAPASRRTYLPCRQPAESLLGDDWFHQAGIPPASSEFELP